MADPTTAVTLTQALANLLTACQPYIVSLIAAAVPTVVIWMRLKANAIQTAKGVSEVKAAVAENTAITSQAKAEITNAPADIEAAKVAVQAFQAHVENLASPPTATTEKKLDQAADIAAGAGDKAAAAIEKLKE